MHLNPDWEPPSCLMDYGLIILDIASELLHLFQVSVMIISLNRHCNAFILSLKMGDWATEIT